MSWDMFLSAFQGIEAILHSSPQMVLARVGLIALGMTLIYLGKKGILEPLLMIPMGLGMAVINASVMMFDPLSLHGGLGTLFLEAQAGSGHDAVKNASDLMYIMVLTGCSRSTRSPFPTGSSRVSSLWALVRYWMSDL